MPRNFLAEHVRQSQVQIRPLPQIPHTDGCLKREPAVRNAIRLFRNYRTIIGFGRRANET